MCLSTEPRHAPSMTSRPIVDAAHLFRRVHLKVDQVETPSAIIATETETETETKRETAQKRYRHIMVQHNYHDHASDCRADYQEEHPARGGVTTPFPLKLHDMLSTMADEGLDGVVSWQPHGRCFLVHRPKELVEALPRYFKLGKLASFQRQLNLYGFQRLTRGRDRGAYYHELFLSDRFFLAHSIHRIKVKGTGVRARSNPEQEPDFWSMPFVVVGGDGSSSSSSSRVNHSSSRQQPQPPQVTSCSIPMPMPTTTTSLESTMNMNMMNIVKPMSSMMPSLSIEEDLVSAFGNKTFHYLDPFQEARDALKLAVAAPVCAPPTTASTSTSIIWGDSILNDLLSGSEADSFFQGFDFPEGLGADIEDDVVFGILLEQMIA